MGLVIDGVFKVARINPKGEEYILYFTNEGHFVVDLESFFNLTPAEENIVALTDCSVITMTRAQYDFLETAIPNFGKIVSQIKEKALVSKYNFKSEMLVENIWITFDNYRTCKLS
jgi:CRP-like cAMP-binding protein